MSNNINLTFDVGASFVKYGIFKSDILSRSNVIPLDLTNNTTLAKDKIIKTIIDKSNIIRESLEKRGESLSSIGIMPSLFPKKSCQNLKKDISILYIKIQPKYQIRFICI